MNENTFDKASQPNNPEQIKTTIEIAKPEDWEDYKKIKLEAIDKEPKAYGATKENKEKENKKTEEDWKKDLTGNETFVVLSKNKDIPIGMAHALLRTVDENHWAVRGVYLNKNSRSSGSGKEMMNLILDEIKRRGGKAVTLNVTDTQEIAKKMYEKLGFQALERFEPEELSDGEMWPGGWWMKKEI